MTSFTSSELSLTPSELSYISINISQLAIAAYAYPWLLLPRLLTATHIAAIQISTYHAVPSTFTVHINGETVADDTAKLIRQARAYGEYYNNLSIEQRRQRTIQENFRLLGWEFIQGMDLDEFGKCIKNWAFMERLELEGEPAQREVLEAGWRAYEQVPRQVKLRLGLLVLEEDEEALVDGVNGVNGVP